MNAYFKNLEIHKITFETGDLEVIVDATIQQGSLSYNSELLLNYSDLNLLLNKMQQQVNENIDISSMFEIEKMYNGNLLYSINFEKTNLQTIKIESINFNNNIKQIRA